MACRIVWSRRAESDLRGVVRYIQRDSPARAQQFGFRLIAQTDALADFPEIGRVVPEFKKTEVREIVLNPYRNICRVQMEKNLVEIVRIWHGARNTPIL